MTRPTAGTERRASERFDIRFGAEVHTPSGMIEASTHDVSRGGCRLESSRPLPEGTEVDLDLCIMIDGIQDPDYPHIRTRAHIRWTAESEQEGGAEIAYVSGVEFSGLPASQADWLEQVLQRASR
jgi:hypothetical protein